MNLELTGTILRVLPEVTGQGARGPWRKQEFLIEVPGDYPKQVLMSLWGDRISEAPLTEGATVTVSFSLESREYNGRYYTDVRAFRVLEGGPSAARGQRPARGQDMGEPEGPYGRSTGQSRPAAAPAAPAPFSSGDDDDLPF